MKTLPRTLRPWFLLPFLALAGGGRAQDAAPAAPAAPPPKPAVIRLADFREKLELFAYGTWKDALVPGQSGLVVPPSKGAQGNGGFGRNVAPALDLSKETWVEIALGLGDANQVPAITVAFNDADGTQCAARFAVGQISPQQPVWLRARRSDFARVKGQDGGDGKMDWTRVAQWHVQGDWTTHQPFHAVFIALQTKR